jgi:predicted NBD/HSP70 family sugar kinase
MTQRAQAQHAATPATFPKHGALALPSVEIDAYNAELRDGDGFVGDRASNRAFRAILDGSRDQLRKVTDDPLGDTPTEDISKKKLDKVLAEGDPEAAGVVHGAIEDFANELADVTRRFVKTKDWKGTQRIVVGGGLRASRVGELAIGRASVLLKSDGLAIDLTPIRNHPDHAGLLGTIHLAPSWIFGGYDAVLAVDIGGSNMRAGIVSLGTKKKTDLSEAAVHAVELWRHGDDKPKRDEAVDRLVKMLTTLTKQAEKDGLSLAPFLGIGCPGVIEEDGSIARGGQNLPGNWESSRFNLPALLCEKIPKIGEHHTHVVMHNDAVVQGLSEVPWMTDIERWGVLTIGTGLGNARFTNRPVDSTV